MATITADHLGEFPRSCPTGDSRGVFDLAETAATACAFRGVPVNDVAPGLVQSLELDTHVAPFGRPEFIRRHRPAARAPSTARTGCLFPSMEAPTGRCRRVRCPTSTVSILLLRTRIETSLPVELSSDRRDGDVPAVVLRGGDHFYAGADLREVPEDVRMGDNIRRYRRPLVPTIAPRPYR